MASYEKKYDTKEYLPFELIENLIKVSKICLFI